MSPSAVDQAEAFIQRGGHVHLMGIGGIGMAGVAWLLKARGFKVSGCDLQSNRQTAWLIENGVVLSVGHDESHMTSDVDWVVRSTAVPDSHPEVARALAMGIPVSRRGEVLPALMRARICIAVSGTHGKTTTTSMIAQMLGCGFCVGGEMVGVAGVARDGEIMVVEADESDGTVAGYTPDYAMITNIEYDHMEHHASEAAFIGCFEQLARNTKRGVYYRADDPIVCDVVRRVCADREGDDCFFEPFSLPDVKWNVPLPGLHNQWNAAAAVAVCRNWLNETAILDALQRIRPVRRRFETVFEGGGIQVVSDYAHHPTEVAALIQTAKELAPKRLLGIFQPHRYTRTLALGEAFPPSFEGLDALWLVPVYAASEKPIDGGRTEDLMMRFPDRWGTRLQFCDGLSSAWETIKEKLQPGDLLLVIGAGDIEQIAEWARSL